MQKSTVCALGDAAVKTMDRLVPLSELTSTEDNFPLTLIDGLTMETVVEALSVEPGVWCIVGNYVKIIMPSDISKILTVHTNSCILYILALLCIGPYFCVCRTHCTENCYSVVKGIPLPSASFASFTTWLWLMSMTVFC